jgi:hypothetical protein
MGIKKQNSKLVLIEARITLMAIVYPRFHYVPGSWTGEILAYCVGVEPKGPTLMAFSY